MSCFKQKRACNAQTPFELEKLFDREIEILH